MSYLITQSMKTPHIYQLVRLFIEGWAGCPSESYKPALTGSTPVPSTRYNEGGRWMSLDKYPGRWAHDE